MTGGSTIALAFVVTAFLQLSGAASAQQGGMSVPSQIKRLPGEPKQQFCDRLRGACGRCHDLGLTRAIVDCHRDCQSRLRYCPRGPQTNPRVG
jgi:hypothetical protein